MGSLFRFPSRPAQAVRIVRLSQRVWIVDIASPCPNASNPKRFRTEREAVAYANGFCDATGFQLLLSNDGSRNVA